MSAVRPILPSCIVLYAIACGIPMGKYVTGSYLRDVELIGPPSQAELNTVYYYPSYVKGEDPVEEYNRRRLHVDTANFMEYEETPTDAVGQKHSQQQKQQPASAVHTQQPHDDDCCLKAKRKRKYRGSAVRHPKQHATDPMRVIDAQTDHEYNYMKIRQAGTGAPRYVRDDVEIFDIDRGNQIKAKRPIRRRTRTAHEPRDDGQRRYEESDPQVFAYERSDVVPSGRANGGQPEASQDDQYFQYAEIFGDGSFAAGARRGNDQHYLEQLERGSHGIGVFQKKVKWADKKGGFGEHYWDLNHIQPDPIGHKR